MKESFKVLSPWSETDPKPLKGLAPRIPDLLGKKIGFFYNLKRASKPIANAVAANMQKKFPNIEISWYPGQYMGVKEIESNTRTKFEDWLKDVDAVIATVGD